METLPTPWKFVDSYETFVWRRIDENTEESVWVEHPRIKEWLAEGNTIEPYVAPEPPAPLTPAEKLAASGLTVDELKELLGL